MSLEKTFQKFFLEKSNNRKEDNFIENQVKWEMLHLSKNYYFERSTVTTFLIFL